MESEDNEQSLTDHLVELRVRVVQALYGLILGFGFCFIKSEAIFDIIRRPIVPFLGKGGLVFTAPMDKFMAHIKVSVLGGVILSCPWWIYQLWQFIAPGLYAKERKYTVAFILSGSVLFLIGVCFVYFLVYPVAFEFLMNYGGGTDQAMITISEYLSFFITTTIVFGLAFELPLVLTLLGLAGLVDKAFLSGNRRYAIVLLAVVSAVITPSSDVMSMMMLMVPLCILYEIGVFMVGVLAQNPGSK